MRGSPWAPIVPLERRPQLALAGVGGGNRDQRTARGQQRRPYSAKDFRIWIGRTVFGLPKSDFVSHGGNAGQAANATKRGGPDRDFDRRAAIEQSQTVGGAADHHFRQHWLTVDDACDIPEHHLRLLLRPSQAQHEAALARNQLGAIVDHGREIDQQRRNGSRFAAASSDDAPQFVDPLARLALAARKLCEDCSFFVRQSLAHGGDEQDAPAQPTVAAQRGAQEMPIAQSPAHRDERRHVRLLTPLALAAGSAAEAVSEAASPAMPSWAFPGPVVAVR